MDKSNRSTTGLTYMEDVGLDVWRGTAEQLIGAGLVEMHMLPGQPGRNKNCVTIVGSREHNSEAGIFFFRIQKLARDRFVVFKGITDAEHDRRHAHWLRKHREENERRERELEYSRKMASVKACLDRMPKSAAEFKEILVGIFPDLDSQFWFENGFGNGIGRGYHFDGKATKKIYQLVKQINDVMATGGVLYNHDVRCQAIEKIYEREGLEAPRHVPRLRLVKHEPSGKAFGDLINEIKSAKLD